MPQNKRSYSTNFYLKAGVILLLVLVAFGALAGCGAKPEDILEQYAACRSVGADENKAGIFVDSVSKAGNRYFVELAFSNAAINQNENNVSVLTARVQVYDAEEPETTVAFRPMLNTVTKTAADGTSASSFSGGISIDRDDAPRYALLCFAGVESAEASELATPPLFFIVQLDGDTSDLLTDTPLLSAGLPARQ